MTEKTDIFYYGYFYGVPVFFQPETNELLPRNRLYLYLLHLVIPVVGQFTNEFGVKLIHRTITREKLKLKGFPV